MNNLNIQSIDNIIDYIKESEQELRKLANEIDIYGQVSDMNKYANVNTEYLDTQQVLNFIKAFMG